MKINIFSRDLCLSCCRFSAINWELSQNNLLKQQFNNNVIYVFNKHWTRKTGMKSMDWILKKGIYIVQIEM